MRKTKIICTLGPAVDSDEMIEKMIVNGMDCARLNFSHGTHEEQKARMDRVKRIRAKLGSNTPIMLDTKGPEIRIRDFENGSVQLKKGQLFTFCADASLVGDENRAGLTFPKLAENVKVGTIILADDGKVSMTVEKLEGSDVICRLNCDGKLSNHKSINIPDTLIEMNYISEVDRSDILFGVEQDVDYVAASFVRCADDVRQVRQLLDENGGRNIKIISKIENKTGIENLDEIIAVSDGIMVARGDMGVEIPFVKLPAIQKDMIDKCRKEGKIVITATQMLESMTTNMRPTRAEVSDVANSIYDGTTVIMLSGESAAGKYPVESVRTMAEIAIETEKEINYRERFLVKESGECHKDFRESIAMASVAASFCTDAKAIVCMSITGATVSELAKYNTAANVLASVTDEKVARQMKMVWNVYPYLSEKKDTTDELFERAAEIARESQIAKSGDTIIITASASVGGGQGTDVMKLHTI